MNIEVRKIAYWILATFACVLVFDFGIGKVFDKLMEGLPSEGEKVSKSNYIINNVECEVLVIGSSRAQSHYDTPWMREKLVDKSVFNCGVDGSGFLYHVAVMNCILSRYTPEVVIWDVPFGVLGETSVSENLGLLYPYYWENSYLRNFLDKEEPDLKYIIWMNAFRYNSTAGRIIRASKAHIRPMSGFYPKPAADASRTIKPKEVNLEKITTDEDKVRLLEQTLERANKQGTKVFVVISPYFDTYRNTDASNKTLEDICNRYAASFINDGQLEEFVGNEGLIYDAVHLNPEGARFFTQILIKQLGLN